MAPRLARDEQAARANRLAKVAVLASMTAMDPDVVLTAARRAMLELAAGDMSPACEVKGCGKPLAAGQYRVDGDDGKAINVCSGHAILALRKRERGERR